MTFREWLTANRHRYGLRKIADATGFSRGHISNVANGNIGPSKFFSKCMCDFAGEHIDFVIHERPKSRGYINKHQRSGGWSVRVGHKHIGYSQTHEKALQILEQWRNAA